MNTPPYQEGVNYQRDTVIRNSASLFGGEGVYIGVVTKPIDGVQYKVTFQRSGEAPYAGQIIKCVSVKKL